jgi:hypothetical protein
MDTLESKINLIKFETCRGFGDSRRKMTTDNTLPKILFFCSWRRKGRELSRGRQMYPEIETILHQIAKTHFPLHRYNTVQINKNVKCKPHLDKANLGDTVIFSLGDFTNGGRLIVEEDPVDIYKKPFVFNGAEVLHGTEDYLGDRYAVIYYNSKLAN